MPEVKKTPNMGMWVFGVVLIVVIVFVALTLMLVYSQADPVTQETQITNVAPSIGTIYISDSQYGESHDYVTSPTEPEPGIDLEPGGTQTVHINGRVTDANGVADAANWTLVGKFYRTSVTSSCSADDNNCYEFFSWDCTTNVLDSTTFQYDCPIALQYYADATDAVSDYSGDKWTPFVYVSDGGLNDFGIGSYQPDMNTLLALTIPDTIDYGTLANDTATSFPSGTTEYQTYVQQGNDEADVEVSGNTLNCDAGTIPVGNTQWSLTGVNYDDPGTNDLTGTPTTAAINVGYRTNGVVNKDLYWNIYVPFNVSGSCSGSATMTAIAH
ncbi:hypothetical protein ACFL2B_01990 [Patescibacteria group bacterium]